MFANAQKHGIQNMGNWRREMYIFSKVNNIMSEEFKHINTLRVNSNSAKLLT